MYVGINRKSCVCVCVDDDVDDGDRGGGIERA